MFFKFISFQLLIVCAFSQNTYFVEKSSRYVHKQHYNEVYNSQSLASAIAPYSNSELKQGSKEVYINYQFEKFYYPKNIADIFRRPFKNSNDSIVDFLTYHATTYHWISLNGKFSAMASSKNSSTSVFEFTYSLKGQIENWHFYFDRSDISVIGDKNNFKAQNAYAAKSIVRTGSTDLSYGYLVYDIAKSNYAYIGKIPWEIGFGESGKFILNGRANSPITSIGFSYKLWKIRYHTMHGSLLASELNSIKTDSIGQITNTYRDIPDKFLVNHRFELEMSENILLHYNETIVYGNRTLDLNYLNPFVFLRPQEHELHDRDNALITLGFKWRIPSLNLLNYHDILLDEWRISEVFSNWFGNKHGILNGLTWANYNFQAWFEHVSIRPFTYTHKFDVNRYTHDGRALGYFAGPNSQTFFYKIAYYPNSSWRFWLSHRVTHKGKNFEEANKLEWNIGGDIFKAHVNENTGTTESITDNVAFLSGNIQTELESQINIIYEPNYYIKTELNYTYNNLDYNSLRLLFRIQL